MNKYANLVGTNKIKDEYTKINIGFDRVEADINKLETDVTAVNTRVDTIITTPISGQAATQEIVDARVSAVKSKTFASLDARFEETEQDIATHMADTVTDADGVHGFKIEYGTFTPTLSNGTTEVSAYDVAYTVGYYRKLKDVVFFDLSVKVTTIGGVTGSLRIGGFPFATKGETFYAQTSITELENLNFGTDMIGFELFWDTSRLIRSRSASTGLSEFTFSDISDGFFIRASGQYRAAS